jgi:hypothetical protein
MVLIKMRIKINLFKHSSIIIFKILKIVFLEKIKKKMNKMFNLFFY